MPQIRTHTNNALAVLRDRGIVQVFASARAPAETAVDDDEKHQACKQRPKKATHFVFIYKYALCVRHIVTSYEERGLKT